MTVQEIQAYASIVSDLTTVSLVIIALIWVEKRRIELSRKILDDWDDMRRQRHENLQSGNK